MVAVTRKAGESRNKNEGQLARSSETPRDPLPP